MGPRCHPPCPGSPPLHPASHLGVRGASIPVQKKGETMLSSRRAATTLLFKKRNHAETLVENMMIPHLYNALPNN